MIVTQIGIATLGVAAVWLSQDERLERRRWASVCGLASQPFWIAETVMAQQWGILALTLAYGYSWWRGFRWHWLAKRAEVAA